MFSVIVPTYNRLQTLQTLLQSLEAQSLSSSQFEVIVIYTQGDSSESFLKAYNGPLHLTPLFINDPLHNGRSASLKRNAGAKQARYSWLAFIDDDCIADPQWLLNAQKIIHEKNPAALEGYTFIPESSIPTFTEKGLRQLSQFGGYQTCNMFYNKEDFFAVGGFDPHLPFYLEDTDLAWSILDKNKVIAPAKEAIVTHPVPAPRVYRWIDGAIRTKKIPYLAKKHPHLFKKMNFRALSRPIFLTGIGFLFLLAILPLSIAFFGIGVLAYVLLCWLYVFYLLRDCRYSFKELSQMLMIYPLVPPISIFQLLRGNLEHRTFVL